MPCASAASLWAAVSKHPEVRFVGTLCLAEWLQALLLDELLEVPHSGMSERTIFEEDIELNVPIQSGFCRGGR
ncbi:hypothetical protein OAF85_00810 [Planctomycetota bacterium]|nr:hypothetical protein [Planctomycetota bacterium]